MAPSRGANDTKRLNANIPRQLHQDFHVACLTQGEDMTAVLTKFISQYVKLAKNKGTK